MANNERRRGDQDFNHRSTGIVIPLEELKPLTSGDEPINELIVATSARNANDITGVEDSLNNNRNINYTAKKNFSQGMMDIALLTANASQLRYVMRSPYWDFYHKMNITLICISIALQIIAGILLVCVSRKKKACNVGSTRILTSTPEKQIIEDHHNCIQAKKKGLAIPTTNKPRKVKSKGNQDICIDDENKENYCVKVTRKKNCEKGDKCDDDLSIKNSSALSVVNRTRYERAAKRNLFS
ncbi:uncharacterized protein LOC123470412 [Daphnia magna]|uniref:uncharacterized protein LOC123470412 n=1 Tax=Daphnia magna TaxID=35525 RepID=UPI001E1BBF7F|nr:uncharacterized protein LOC123470412 [Daphnia magna]